MTTIYCGHYYIVNNDHNNLVQREIQILLLLRINPILVYICFKDLDAIFLIGLK